MSLNNSTLAQYMCSGDPELSNYYPEWVDNVAEDATLEGSMLDGVIIGADNLRAVVLKIKSLYDRQEFLSVGSYGDNGWIENYVSEVSGYPLGCVVLVERNDAGQTQHVLASYRPRTSVVHFASLLADAFAGTEISQYFR